MAETELARQLSTSVKEALDFKNKALVSRPEWGTITFKNAEHDFHRIFLLLGYLNDLPLEFLPDQISNQIKQKLDQIRPHLDQVNNFNIEQANAIQTRDGLVSQIHNAADQLYTVASPWVPFLFYQKGDVAQNIEKLSASVLKADEILEKAKENVAKKAQEIDGIIEKAREASGAAGAAVFTKDFAEEAKTLSDKAKSWLIASAIIGSSTLLFAVLTWFWSQSGLDTGQLWQKVASKVVILSILITASLWCGRIYKALMHQSTMNRHRALSLQTFQAFSSAASDSQTKDAVLLEATRSIFVPGVTGFIDSSSGSADSEARVIEIVKSVLPKK